MGQRIALVRSQVTRGWSPAAMLGAVCILAVASSMAQQTPPNQLPDAPSATSQQQEAPHDANPVESSKSFLSLLSTKSFVFPTLATGTGPLDPWQKFKLACRNSVSLATIGGVLIGSAYGQAINSPAGYGQGGEGYGKRFGADMARSSSANLIGNFAIASLLHEDPRFYVKRGLSFKKAVKYSAYRVFVTRSDSGEHVANFAGLVGPLAAEALATTYYPDGNNGVGDVFIRYASDMGWQFAGNLFRQYWPTINRRLRTQPPVPEPLPPPKKKK